MSDANRFAQVDELAICDGVITDRAFRVYCLLLSYDWKVRGRRKGFVFPSQETMAERLGRTDRTVRDALKELEEAGYIASRRRGQGQSKEYVLLALPDRQDSSGLDRREPSGPDRRDPSSEADEGRQTNSTPSVGGNHQRSGPSNDGAAHATVVPLRAGGGR
jgi:DNA-binding transcriptional ArsR family regulator